MNEIHQLPTINFNDIHISINANIAGTYLRKKNRRGFLQRRWFYIRFSLSKNENYSLEYSHKPLENQSRQLYLLENASVISSNQKTFTLQTVKADKTTSTIVLEADSKYHKDQWIHTLQHVINVADLRKQYLLYLIQQPLASSDPVRITSDNNNSSKNNNKESPSNIKINVAAAHETHPIVNKQELIKTPLSPSSSSPQPATKYKNENKRPQSQPRHNNSTNNQNINSTITNQQISQIINKYHHIQPATITNNKNNNTVAIPGTFLIHLIYNQRIISLPIFDSSQLPCSKYHLLWPIDIMRGFGWLGTEFELLIECICIIPCYDNSFHDSNKSNTQHQQYPSTSNHNYSNNYNNNTNNNSDNYDIHDENTDTPQPLYFQESIRQHHAIGIHSSLLQPNCTYILQCKDPRLDLWESLSDVEVEEMKNMFIECCDNKYKYANNINNSYGSNSNIIIHNGGDNSSSKNIKTGAYIDNIENIIVLRSEVERQKRSIIQNIKNQLEETFSQFINTDNGVDDENNSRYIYNNSKNNGSNRSDKSPIVSLSQKQLSQQLQLPPNEIDMLLNYKRKKCCYYDEILYKYIRMLHSTAIGALIIDDNNGDNNNNNNNNNNSYNENINNENNFYSNHISSNYTTKNSSSSNTHILTYNEFCLLEAWWMKSLAM